MDISREEIEVLRRCRDIETGGVSLFTRYYFDVELLPHQVMTAHASQPNILTLGGRGSGKTFGWVFTYLWLMVLMPDFRVLWASYSSDQAQIAFREVLEPYVTVSERFHKFLPEGLKSLRRAPYPAIHVRLPWGNYPKSVMTFQTVDVQKGAASRRGRTLDAIHLDEGGLIYDDAVFRVLRPSLRGVRQAPGKPKRMGRFSISTTPTMASWLRDWWRRARDPEYEGYDPSRYLVVQVSSRANKYIDEDQIRSFSDGMTGEELRVEVEGELPPYRGNFFPPDIVEDLFDPGLLELGQVRREHPNAGVLSWWRPVVPGHRYILAADPGSGNPPDRNAGCVMVFDWTRLPMEMVYFDWVAGGGSYEPFFGSLNRAYQMYRPDFAVVDNTGPQMAMDELIMRHEGMYVMGIDSSGGKKVAMLNNLLVMLQRRLFLAPLISGLRVQLLSYQQDDRKLAQDLVMTLTYAAWRMRFMNQRYLEEVQAQREGEVEPVERVSVVRERRMLEQRIRGR